MQSLTMQLYQMDTDCNVVVVYPGTLAKCQCTPLTMHRYNHGEVAYTIIELHCKLNYCSIRCRCGMLSYLNFDLQKRSSPPGSFTHRINGGRRLPSHKNEARESCLHWHLLWMTVRPRVGENFRSILINTIMIIIIIV